MNPDKDLSRLVWRVLLVGVLAAALLTLVGAVAWLFAHGGQVVDYSVFHGAESKLRSPWTILRAAALLDPAALMQLGILLLLATPLARVAFSFVAFLLAKDRAFSVLTLLVLALLLAGLSGLLA